MSAGSATARRAARRSPFPRGSSRRLDLAVHETVGITARRLLEAVFEGEVHPVQSRVEAGRKRRPEIAVVREMQTVRQAAAVQPEEHLLATRVRIEGWE